MAYTTILFDVDGTLCDPGESMLECARYALSKCGVTETDNSRLQRLIGPPLEHAFMDYYGFSESLAVEATGYFRDMMKRDGIALYKAYPGIAELLDELQKSGKQLAVVTSKLNTIANETLAKTNLLNYFVFISAQQPEVVVKKEAILRDALTHLHTTDMSHAVMIGDRKHDVEAAKALGIDSIGVLWGYGDKAELQDEGATHIVATMDELRKLVLG